MSNETLLSLVIPVYNGEATLRETLESVVGQLTPQVEVVISDNASTDRTRDIVREFSRRSGQVRLFENSSNVGPMRNFELVVERASGEFVWLFGDDDMLSPGCIDRVLTVIGSEPDVGFISVNADVYGARWAVRQSNTLGMIEDVKLSGVEETFLRLEDHIGLTPTIVVRRSAWLREASLDPRTDHWMHVRRVLGVAAHENTYCITSPRVMMDQSAVRWNREGLFLTIVVEFLEMVDELNVSDFAKRTRAKTWYRPFWTHIVIAKLNRWKFDARTVKRLARVFGAHPRFWVWDLPLLLTPGFAFRAAAFLMRRRPQLTK